MQSKKTGITINIGRMSITDGLGKLVRDGDRVRCSCGGKIFLMKCFREESGTKLLWRCECGNLIVQRLRKEDADGIHD